MTVEFARLTLGGVSDETKEPIVIRVVGRLAARYPEAPRSHIEDIVAEEYDTLDSGRIRTYIPTLVEHRARDRLHRESSLRSPEN